MAKKKHHMTKYEYKTHKPRRHEADFFDSEDKLQRQSKLNGKKKHDSSLKNRLRNMQWDPEDLSAEEFEDYTTEDSFNEA